MSDGCRAQTKKKIIKGRFTVVYGVVEIDNSLRQRILSYGRFNYYTIKHEKCQPGRKVKTLSGFAFYFFSFAAGTISPALVSDIFVTTSPNSS